MLPLLALLVPLCMVPLRLRPCAVPRRQRQELSCAASPQLHDAEAADGLRRQLKLTTMP